MGKKTVLYSGDSDIIMLSIDSVVIAPPKPVPALIMMVPWNVLEPLKRPQSVTYPNAAYPRIKALELKSIILENE